MLVCVYLRAAIVTAPRGRIQTTLSAILRALFRVYSALLPLYRPLLCVLVDGNGDCTERCLHLRLLLFVCRPLFGKHRALLRVPVDFNADCAETPLHIGLFLEGITLFCLYIGLFCVYL